MIYLLYGSNFQASLEKLNEIIAEYRKKNGDLNIYKFDAEENELEKIKTALQTRSLFSEKKLVVLKHVATSDSKQQIFQILQNLDGDIIVVLWERELDSTGLAELRPHCSKAQEFKSTEKLERPGANIFRLGDTFFSSPREGLRSLLSLLHDGHEDFNLFSYLVNHARVLAVVKYYADRLEPVATKHGIHPYVVKKAGSAIRLISKDALSDTLKSFFEEDHRVKTGLSKPRDSLVKIFLQKD